MFSGQTSHARRACLFFLALALALGVVGSAEAARKKKKDDKDKGKNFTVSEQMHKKLSAAHEALEAYQYEAAAKILRELEGRANRLNDYERALVYQMLGMSQAGQEKYEQALVYFEKCLADAALPNGAIVSTRYTIAQLYMATEEFEKAVQTLEKWFKEVEAPNANAYYLSRLPTTNSIRSIKRSFPPKPPSRLQKNRNRRGYSFWSVCTMKPSSTRRPSSLSKR